MLGRVCHRCLECCAHRGDDMCWSVREKFAVGLELWSAKHTRDAGSGFVFGVDSH